MHHNHVIPMPEAYISPDGVHHAIVMLINEINVRLPHFMLTKELEELMITRAQLNTDIAALTDHIGTAVTEITTAIAALDASSDFTVESEAIAAIGVTITEGLAKLTAAIPHHTV